jgi:predicted Zn-dependent peptidase
MNYTQKTLKNGLRLITIPMKDNPTATVLVLVETGSKYEKDGERGLSHFLEHMCFKGTTNRKDTFTISHELDAIGSQYNAFTGHEYTGYYAKSDKRHINKIFDVVSDIYLNPTFKETEIEKEKGVIIEEINMYEDMPQRHVQDLFISLLYGNQPAGLSITGTKESVKKMNRKDFVVYHQKHYVPRKTTVIVSGAVTPKEVEALVVKYFGKVADKKVVTKQKTKEVQSSPQILVRYKKTDQTHFVLGCRTFSVYDKRNHTLDVLSNILSGGFSSRLFMKLREEMGVAYYVKAGADTFTDHGYFEIRAGVNNLRVTEVIMEVLKECKRLVLEPVTEAELEKTKEYMIGNMKLELESSDAWAMYYGGQAILRKDIESPDQLEKRIRAVTVKDIQELAKQIFKNSTLNLALIGPYKNDKAFKKILVL